MIWVGRSSGCATFPLVGFMICGFMTLLFSAGPTSIGGFLGTLIPFVLFGLPILFVLSLVFAPFARPQTYRPYTNTSVPQGKLKRGESLEEMMSLLDDEDIDELRRRAKQRIAEQIDSGDVEDVQTFEELLSRTKQKRK